MSYSRFVVLFMLLVEFGARVSFCLVWGVIKQKRNTGWRSRLPCRIPRDMSTKINKKHEQDSKTRIWHQNILFEMLVNVVTVEVLETTGVLFLMLENVMVISLPLLFYWLVMEGWLFRMSPEKKGMANWKGEAFFILLFCFVVLICCCWIIYDLIEVLKLFDEGKQERTSQNNLEKYLCGGGGSRKVDDWLLCWFSTKRQC